MPEPVPAENRNVVLKDPALAGFLAWLIPGAGHFYQGRTAKGILFSVCLLGTFFYGCYLSGNRELGHARAVYAWWADEDTRLPYLCQIGIGLPSLPALVQSNRARSGKEPHWGGFMAPPKPEGGNLPEATVRALANQPTLSDLNFKLHWYFELGTVYTMIAGLLNILAIYDACAGPVFTEEKEDKEKSDSQDKPEPAAKEKA